MFGRWLERVVIVAVAVLTITVLVRWVKPVLDFAGETVHAHLAGCVVGGVAFLLLLAKAVHGTRDHSPRLYGCLRCWSVQDSALSLSRRYRSERRRRRKCSSGSEPLF